ncbi:phosphonopyruvate decarboxylase [Roseateles sp. DB2]|uniref:phosphonopyruvate decarboxylase n=1 Tax=Roseateles sp. DB2 TaxID=3453717 RepID=UPI003EEF1110
MLKTSRFIDSLAREGVSIFTGVPCSYLTPLINEVILREDTRYVLASSEGDALSIAAGAWLGGKAAVVLCQNSGLGNMVNPLTSLNEPFGIPVLLLVTWRGRPGEKDEPQHQLMGRITPELLSLMGIPWELLPDDDRAAQELVERAFAYMAREHRPFAIVLPGDIFESGAPLQLGDDAPQLPTRAEVLSAFLEAVPRDAVVVATTGKTGRELFTLDDRPAHLYCVGSMGYASALAHGVALASSRAVYVVDGDGAALMHLGNLSSIGAARPERLVHLVLDNGSYDSTGGQPTASAEVDFAQVARASGYAGAQRCADLGAFSEALAHASATTGPHLIHMPIRRGSMDKLGRPTLTPHAVARRLQGWIEA